MARWVENIPGVIRTAGGHHRPVRYGHGIVHIVFLERIGGGMDEDDNPRVVMGIGRDTPEARIDAEKTVRLVDAVPRIVYA